MTTMRILPFIFTVTVPLLAGCGQDVKTAIYEGQSGFGFAANVLNVEVSDEDMNRISVPIYRGSEEYDMVGIGFEYDISASGSSEPEWADEDPDGVFSLTTSNVIFADGANTAYALVRFNDIDKLGVTDKYRIRLTLKNDVSPSGRSQVIMTVSRKLTFNLIGTCDYFDICMFEKSYQSKIYKAEEAEIYRVEDPYSEGLMNEEYAANGWMGTPSEFVEFSVDDEGYITYEPFCTGMLVEGVNRTYCYYPSTYVWGKDFSEFDKENKKISDTEFQLYPVYCLPDFQYGFLNDGAYPITVEIIEDLR